MKKLTMIAAVAFAAGVALYTYPQGMASPPSAGVPGEDRATVDHVVERHLAAVLRQRLRDLQEERAWALGLR